MTTVETILAKSTIITSELEKRTGSIFRLVLENEEDLKNGLATLVLDKAGKPHVKVPVEMLEDLDALTEVANTLR